MTAVAADRAKSARRDGERALAIEAVGLVLAALVLPVAARRLGPTGVGAYTVAFRLVSALQPLALVGCAVALPRLLAHRPLQERVNDGRWLGSALALVAVPAVVAAVVVAVASAPLGLGSASGVAAPLLIAAVVFSICVGYLRGTFLMRRASWLTLGYSGAVPLLALAVFSDVRYVLWFISGGAMLLSALVVGRASLTRPVPDRAVMCRLATFGLRRVPGEIALFSLLASPPLIVAAVTNTALAGRVSIGISLVVYSGAAVGPVASVLLAHVGRAIADDAFGSLRRFLRVWLLIVGAAMFGLSVAVVLAAVPLGRLVYGSPAVATQLRFAALALPGYALYVYCRAVIDAVYDTARVSLHVFIACAVGLVVGAGSAATSLSVDRQALLAFAAATTSLGFTSAADVLRLVGRTRR